MGNDGLGKKAEQKLRVWLDKPEDGLSFERLPDQLSGFYGSKNKCDFIVFKSPYMIYLESKSTWEDRFDFSMISDYQYESLLDRSKIENVFGYVAILFATYKRCFLIDINQIAKLKSEGKKSININKIDKWNFKYSEIPTLPSKKKLLDYTGNIIDLIT